MNTKITLTKAFANAIMDMTRHMKEMAPQDRELVRKINNVEEASKEVCKHIEERSEENGS